MTHNMIWMASLEISDYMTTGVSWSVESIHSFTHSADTKMSRGLSTVAAVLRRDDPSAHVSFSGGLEGRNPRPTLPAIILHLCPDLFPPLSNAGILLYMICFLRCMYELFEMHVRSSIQYETSRRFGTLFDRLGG
jgi:hypothetical protein